MRGIADGANRNLRKQTREARRLLDKKADQAISEFRNGAKASKKANAFQWIIETAKDRPWSKDDLILLQLQLSLAAIHTTTVSRTLEARWEESLANRRQELATWNIVQLCKNPEIVKPLREEVINILSEEGCKCPSKVGSTMQQTDPFSPRDQNRPLQNETPRLLHERNPPLGLLKGQLYAPIFPSDPPH